MYKRNAQGWSKHLDFMVLDIIVLQLAYIIAYFIRNRDWVYSVHEYRTLGLVLFIADVLVIVLNNSLAPWAKLYKKEFLDAYDDFRFDIGIAFDDVPFHVKSVLRAKKISFINKCLSLILKSKSPLS